MWEVEVKDMMGWRPHRSIIESLFFVFGKFGRKHSKVKTAHKRL